MKETGVTATWLSPIFSSPQVDQGYDIDDYRKIDELFGNMSDFEELVREAKKLGIKIILDFVPNHTSNKHEWFIKSENKTPGFEDFYIWRDGEEGTPPNNWVRTEYYFLLHNRANIFESPRNPSCFVYSSSAVYHNISPI